MSWPVLRSRLLAPPPQPDSLDRAELLERMQAAPARLALVAGPGYGKSQLLATWAQAQGEVAWLTLAGGEEDAHGLLVYLVAAVEAVHPEASLGEGLREGVEGGRWRRTMDGLLSQLSERGTHLVLDEAHTLEGECRAVVDYLLRFATSRVLLGARQTPDLSGWSGLLARGELEVWGAPELTLSQVQVESLGVPYELTGGWPMAVDSFRRLGTAAPAEELAAQVWSQLSQALQDFLLRCSVLDYLSEDECQRLAPQGARMLRQMAQHGVVLAPAGDGRFRVHPLFLEFLRDQARARHQLVASSHRWAAQALLDEGLFWEAVPHLLAGRRQQEARELLADRAEELLQAGAHRKLIAWMEGLGEQEAAPGLRLAYAEALSRASLYERALVIFEELAEQARVGQDPLLEARCLCGAARMYVDTLQPERAGGLLRRAYRLNPSEQSRSQVLELLAENYLNQGRSRSAARLRQRALSAGAEPRPMDVRLLLRTGRLAEARQACVAGGGSGHREGSLILAYLEALEGDAQQAESLSRQVLAGIPETFTEAVAWMRLGHALQLKLLWDEAREAYQKALALTEQTGVARLRAEILMGEALLAAARGDVSASYAQALDGLELTRQAGDAWLCAWLRLAAGIAALQGGHPQGSAVLEQAEEELRSCADSFGVCLARLWRGMGQPAALQLAAQEARSRGYGFLLERPTLFGPRSWEQPLVVDRPALPGASVSLRMTALGPLRVFRGGQEVDPRAFKRRKARELLALLLNLRGGFASKDELCDLLFPDSAPKAAVRDLRVALHSLFEVLDPDRPHNATARCLERREDRYSLPWSESLSLDVRDFEQAVERGHGQPPEQAAELWQRALGLYRGDYLEDFPYVEWAQPTRERLRLLYVSTAERLARWHLEQGHEEQALELAHAILSRDRCWEGAYQLLMRCHLRSARGFLATRVYDQCAQALREELGVEPGEETESLYQQALA